MIGVFTAQIIAGSQGISLAVFGTPSMLVVTLFHVAMAVPTTDRHPRQGAARLLDSLLRHQQ
ncbi:hypothetical protein [Streptomyces sp. NPDC097610]|uniref:hypothetical protein n=1 Tax=Streptomyces sp. NPDC097610 TaxID=3157227 RepID=UPI00331B2CA9